MENAQNLDERHVDISMNTWTHGKLGLVHAGAEVSFQARRMYGSF
jgi:hypothetical protein